MLLKIVGFFISLYWISFGDWLLQSFCSNVIRLDCCARRHLAFGSGWHPWLWGYSSQSRVGNTALLCRPFYSYGGKYWDLGSQKEICKANAFYFHHKCVTCWNKWYALFKSKREKTSNGKKLENFISIKGTQNFHFISKEVNIFIKMEIPIHRPWLSSGWCIP